MPVTFERPVHATKHCRHYSWERSEKWSDSGPRCAVGQDLSEPGISRRCMPDAGDHACSDRAEYTEAEREAWAAWRDEGTARLIAAIAAVPHPIPLRTGGFVECPNCGGQLRYDRWHRGASIACLTENCCAARFNIAAGADWPAGKGA